jgi:hypothetical protein
MQVGITGHQERPGIDWEWVSGALLTELGRLRDVTKAFSSLAAGSDQIFARVALAVGIPVVAVIPMDGYERFFAPSARADYETLLQQCEIANLGWTRDDQAGFFQAGKFIVDRSDLLFAVWDGKRSKRTGWYGGRSGLCAEKVHASSAYRS